MTQHDGQPACARILVVDDDVDSAEMFQELLQASGHAVRVAFDGPTALLHAGSFQPQVVFLDLTMPGMDGFELCRRLTALAGPRPRIIAVSGQAHLTEDELCQVGFSGVLPKPIEWEHVGAIIARFA
jgi:CheY-like chemotaxis protein